jgi:phage terminase large subunit GpA-like protein
MSDFANIDDVVRRAMTSWRPPSRLTLSQWADEYFYLSRESAADHGRWKCLPYQRGMMDAITDPATEQISVMKSARVGYALALETPIATPTGWTTMGDLRVGDAVFSDLGVPCKVTCKSDVFTGRPCYRVSFCDGSSIIADADHRWQVESDVSLEQLGSGRRGRTGRPKPGEVRTFVGVVDTRTMALALAGRDRTPLAVRNASPLEAPLLALPVPPYTLGLWLGDGHMVAPRVTQHRSDVETARYIEREGIRVAVGYPDARYPNNATFWLDCSGGRENPSPWAARLRSLGVLSNKHIPPAYLRAHASQRLELLRGLMDSDGTISSDGRAEFNNTNENLARGVYELVVSLGMKASLRKRPPQRAPCLEQFSVNFKPAPDINPFNLSRKAARVLASSKPTIARRRRIVSVEPVESVPTQCIEVDSESHLFLAGRQMVPTHNTKCMNAAIGYYMHQAPCPILVVQPTVDDAKGYSKEEIAPMLRDCPELSKIVFEDNAEEVGPKGSGNTILHKSFPGGVLSMVGANSGAGFRRISRKVIIFDEVDGYPPSAGSDGDQIKLGTKRSEFYWDRKIIAGSTPLVSGISRIETLFEAGDQRRYYVPCPQCDHMAYLVFSGEAGHRMAWPKGRPEEAHFVCQLNGCVIEHSDKRTMVERGEWRAAKPSRGHASFHIWAAYSYSPNAQWKQIAEEFITSKENPQTLKTFVNTVLGETWKDRGEAPDWERLYHRREARAPGVVPAGVQFLTAGVDVQKDRCVYEVVGWGEDKQSWSVDAGVIPMDTSAEAEWTRLDELLDRRYTSETGAPMAILMLAVDSGYNTQMVYNWARRHPMSRVIAVKGVKTARALLGTPSSVDVTVRGKKLARGYKVWAVGADLAKAEFYGWLRLQLPEPGAPFPAGWCHFPEHGPDYFRQLTAEHLVTTVTRAGYSVQEWQLAAGRENHFLDCRVYARAAASLAGLDRQARRAPAAPAPTPAPAAPVPSVAPPRRPYAPDSRFHAKKKGWLR